jgi:NTP pyrophosphatase (non-canonical NTP hydrolase)
VELTLADRPTLAEFQRYLRELEIARGFSTETVLQKCLLLGEEVGELFKAVRKREGIAIDASSRVGDVDEELVDVFMYVLALANRLDVDLEAAFRTKEEKNKRRVWAKA